MCLLKLERSSGPGNRVILKLSQKREQKWQYKKCLASLIRKDKNVHYNNMFIENDEDMKKTWKIIWSLLSKNTKHDQIKSLVIKTHEFTNDRDILPINLIVFSSHIAVSLNQWSKTFVSFIFSGKSGPYKTWLIFLWIL